MESNEKLRKILENPVRIAIFTLIMNPENKNATITEVHKGLCHELEKQYDYKNTYKHIKFLEEIGVIKLNKQEKKQQGKPVYIELIDPNLKDMFLKFLELIKPDIIKELKKNPK